MIKFRIKILSKLKTILYDKVHEFNSLADALDYGDDLADGIVSAHEILATKVTKKSAAPKKHRFAWLVASGFIFAVIWYLLH